MAKQGLIIDCFAGGGGASLGIEMALGRSPDVAINHDADALAMHAVNHPMTQHINSNIWKIDPRDVRPGEPIDLLWASPDCKHHSKAKGGKPLSRNIRDLAWVAVLWAQRRRPNLICLENVEEFRDWGPLGGDDRPIAERRGETFKQWVRAFKREGYRLQWRELRACDYGAPTIRKRLFLIARCDDAAIVWPDATHADPRAPAVAAGRLIAWRTAAEIIDWSLPCPSIFLTREEGRAVGCNRPLAENTMARIAKGVKRYVIDAAEPFIVPVTHAGDTRVHRVDEPLRTVTTAQRGEHALVAPVIAGLAHGESGGRRAYPLGEPLTTVQAEGNNQALVAPYLVPRYGERPGQAPRTRSVEDPSPTIVPTGNGGSLAAVHLQRQFGASVGSAADDPIGTVTAGGGGKTAVLAAHLTKFQTGSVGAPMDAPAPTVTANSFVKRPGGAAPIGVVAAFLAQHNADRPGHSCEEPVSTIMADGTRQAVAAAFLAQHNYLEPGHDAREPVSTIVAKGCTQAVVAASFLSHAYTSNTAGGQGDLRKPKKTVLAGGLHASEVRAFLVKYYGADGQAQTPAGPLHTVPTKPRFGLVTVKGEPYEIVDIGMRMLRPRELFRAQGFPDTYVIDRRPDGSKLTATASVRMCGNSVSPVMARAIVAANFVPRGTEDVPEFVEAAE